MLLSDSSNNICSDGHNLLYAGFSEQDPRFHDQISPIEPTNVSPGFTAAGNDSVDHANSRPHTPRTLNPSLRLNNDPRPPDHYRTLYRRPRNSSGLFDCFKDCPKARLADYGFDRRGNLWAHLRDYHEQDIPRGG